MGYDYSEISVDNDLKAILIMIWGNALNFPDILLKGLNYFLRKTFSIRLANVEFYFKNL